MKELIDLLNKGWNFVFANRMKHIHGQYVIRICWNATYKAIDYSCEWEGFDTPEECINDFIKFTKTIK